MTQEILSQAQICKGCMHDATVYEFNCFYPSPNRPRSVEELLQRAAENIAREMEPCILKKIITTYKRYGS